MKIYCLVGMKYGDLCSVLPLLYHDFKTTGRKVAALVAAPYTGLFNGCSYVLPETWSGDWQDLRGAIGYCKSRFGEVVVPSTFGKDWPLEKRTQSFQLDQWLRAGELEHFDEWPMVFDQRNREREAALVKQHAPSKRFILYADRSESSPFAAREDLFKLLSDNFGQTHDIIRLSDIKAEQIYDLAGLYDKAAALVSIETVHLHLSGASGVPVIALATDKPEMWHGAAYAKRFVLHRRYADYETSKPEIVRAVRDAIDLKTGPELEATKTLFPNGYNPSLIQWQGKTFTTYRYHPLPDHWRTLLALHDGQNTFKIQPPDKFKDYSIEDGRLFLYRDKLMLSYTVGRTVNNMHRCVVQYGELVPDKGVWKIINAHQPNQPGNDFSRMEKNWSFIVSDGHLYALYQRGPEQIALHLDGSKVMSSYRSKTPAYPFGTPRGGTFPIPHDGLWLQFFHTNLGNPKSAQWWNYHVGALLMETKPPFQIKAISKHPVLSGNEKFFPNAPRWKPKVVFPMGAIKVGNEFHVSLGVNDAACAVARVKPEHLNL